MVAGLTIRSKSSPLMAPESIAADDYQTRLSYTAPAALVSRYGLSAELAARLASIDALTSAVIAR
jgi:hypothetical protein